MALTVADIENVSFSNDFRGYNVDEVDDFLEHLAAEVGAMIEENESLRAKLAEKASLESQPTMVVNPVSDSRLAEEKAAAADAAVAAATATHVQEIAGYKARIAELEKRLDNRQADDSAVGQALIVAQRAADEVTAQAKKSAVVIQQDAEDEARRIIGKANAEKQRILDVIDGLQADRDEVRENYQVMLMDFISDATRRLTAIGGDEALVSKVSRKVEGSTESLAATATVAPVDEDRIRAAERLETMTATYTTPSFSPSVNASAAVHPAVVEKDLSGFGDADSDFAFDDLD